MNPAAGRVIQRHACLWYSRSGVVIERQYLNPSWSSPTLLSTFPLRARRKDGRRNNLEGTHTSKEPSIISAHVQLHSSDRHRDINGAPGLEACLSCFEGRILWVASFASCRGISAESTLKIHETAVSGADLGANSRSGSNNRAITPSSTKRDEMLSLFVLEDNLPAFLLITNDCEGVW